MLDRKMVEGIIKSKIGDDWILKFNGEQDGCYLFLCESKDSNQVPNKMAYAFNKKTYKTGMSIFGFDDAIEQLK